MEINNEFIEQIRKSKTDSEARRLILKKFENCLSLIGKQQLKIEEYENYFKENEKNIKIIENKLYNIGAPFNDNKLNFNQEQLKYIWEIKQLIDNIYGFDVDNIEDNF
jgi:hypothetical protein